LSKATDRNHLRSFKIADLNCRSQPRLEHCHGSFTPILTDFYSIDSKTMKPTTITYRSLTTNYPPTEYDEPIYY